jgi:hypothetical protein
VVYVFPRPFIVFAHDETDDDEIFTNPDGVNFKIGYDFIGATLGG